ncbi:MAG TPA: hypothetical protein VMU22_00400 [Rhizomicrobium sp.]|nr:hypothetical protein [Rhizomicrobium sp.]
MRVFDNIGILAQRIWAGFLETIALFGRYAPFSGTLALLFLALAFSFFIISAIGTFVPSVGNWSFFVVTLIGRLPGPAAFCLCAGLLLGPLSFLTFWLDLCKFRIPFWVPRRIVYFELKRPPVIIGLLVVMILTAWWVSLHNVRVIEPAAGSMSPNSRASLDAEWAAWRARCAPGETTPHPIIVAISGGASRAGLWGLRVLDEVDNEAPRHTSIFAVSSVSGGSLGAAAYLSTLADQDSRSCTLDRFPDDPERTLRREQAFQDAMRADALGPLLAGLLWGDVARALLGLPADVVRRGIDSVHRTAAPGQSIDTAIRGGDRADALEEAFERNWRDAVAAHQPFASGVYDFSAPYLALFYDAQGKPRGEVPLWLANGSDDQSGDRILTAPFSFAFAGASPFPAAKDALGLLHADIRISTAIDNTARFPYLSPAGELAPVGDPPAPNPAQIIDGGYFENEGLQTALELARWLRRHGADPVVVEASADADPIEEDQIPRCDRLRDDPERPNGQQRPLQLLAPVIGVYTARSGHSNVALRDALREFCGASGQRFFHFYLYDKPDGGIPLNWALSEAVARYIWDAELGYGGNADELQRLKATLGKL